MTGEMGGEGGRDVVEDAGGLSMAGFDDGENGRDKLFAAWPGEQPS
jgi:hypothetical protein